MTEADTAASARTAAEAALAEDDSLTGSVLRWAMGLLAAPRPATDEELNGRFVRAFLDKHPDGFSTTLEKWRARGPFTVLDHRPFAYKGWLTLADGEGDRHTLTVGVDSNGLVRNLHLQPEVVIPEVRDWDDLEKVLRATGTEYSVLAARSTSNGYEILHETTADRAMPTGSAYKLYVMRALLRAVEDGTLGWDDEVTVRPELRSLPTGDMQDLPDGTRVTVRETAHKMIAMSDNTAADLIIDRVGREAVERAVVDSGHHDPSLLRPFLASREVFEIGWGDPELRETWAGGDESARRRLLLRTARPITVRGSDLGETVHHLGLDWHMSAFDVLRVLHGLWEDSARDTTGIVEEILTAYPGVPIDGTRWPKAVFKGGSCPGVMMFCWLLEDRNGTPHVVVLQQAAADQKAIGDGLLLRGLGGRVIESGLLESREETAS